MKSHRDPVAPVAHGIENEVGARHPGPGAGKRLEGRQRRRGLGVISVGLRKDCDLDAGVPSIGEAPDESAARRRGPDPPARPDPGLRRLAGFHALAGGDRLGTGGASDLGGIGDVVRTGVALLLLPAEGKCAPRREGISRSDGNTVFRASLYAQLGERVLEPGNEPQRRNAFAGEDQHNGLPIVSAELPRPVFGGGPAIPHRRRQVAEPLSGFQCRAAVVASGFALGIREFDSRGEVVVGGARALRPTQSLGGPTVVIGAATDAQAIRPAFFGEERDVPLVGGQLRQRGHALALECTDMRP